MRDVDTWNRPTDLREEGLREPEEISQRKYMHTYIHSLWTQTTGGEGQGGSRSWVEEGECGENWGTFIIVSTI